MRSGDGSGEFFKLSVTLSSMFVTNFSASSFSADKLVAGFLTGEASTEPRGLMSMGKSSALMFPWDERSISAPTKFLASSSSLVYELVRFLAFSTIGS